MIRELIQFTENLDSEVFKWNLPLSEGLHIIVDFDNDGRLTEKNHAFHFDKEQKTFQGILADCQMFEVNSTYIPSPPPAVMNKALDKQIYSCSPFVFSFTKKNLEDPKSKIRGKVGSFFKKAKEVGLSGTKDVELLKKVEQFENYLSNQFWLDLPELQGQKIVKNKVEEMSYEKLKEPLIVAVYLRQPIEKYMEAHQKYLAKNLLNDTETFNITVNDIVYGLGSYFNSFSSKKPFLNHQTGITFNGINARWTEADAMQLFKLGQLQNENKTLPNPLPLVIDYSEIDQQEGRISQEDLIDIFREGEFKFGYAEMLEKVFSKKDKKVLSNYYLLNFGRNDIRDFDFVPHFRYHLAPDTKPSGWPILNLVNHTEQDKETKQREKKIYPPLKTIFDFEMLLHEKFFYMIQTKSGFRKPFLRGNYFGKPDVPKGHELRAAIQHNLFTWRQGIYNYVYKSRIEALDRQFWYRLGLTTVLDEIKTDDSYNHTNPIREKLNIWFSLNQHFDPSHENFNSQDMKSKIPTLLVRMREVANNDGIHFADTHEFAFAAGQVIYFLFSKSEAGDRTHAVLEAFVQKQTCQLLQESISQLIVRYKHALSYGHGRFERLAKELLGFDTDENMLRYVPTLLAGYFAENVIYASAAKP